MQIIFFKSEDCVICRPVDKGELSLLIVGIWRVFFNTMFYSCFYLS